MSLRKSLIEVSGFAAIVVVVEVLLAKPEGPAESFLIGVTLALLYIPVFNFLYREGPGQAKGRAADSQRVRVTLKHGQLSRFSSLGMLLLGVVTLLFVSGFFGLILIAVGFAMFWLYRRQAGGSGAEERR